MQSSGPSCVNLRCKLHLRKCTNYTDCSRAGWLARFFAKIGTANKDSYDPGEGVKIIRAHRLCSSNLLNRTGRVPLLGPASRILSSTFAVFRRSKAKTGFSKWPGIRIPNPRHFRKPLVWFSTAEKRQKSNSEGVREALEGRQDIAWGRQPQDDRPKPSRPSFEPRRGDRSLKSPRASVAIRGSRKGRCQGLLLLGLTPPGYVLTPPFGGSTRLFVHPFSPVCLLVRRPERMRPNTRGHFLPQWLLSRRSGARHCGITGNPLAQQAE